jgi:hypothetical protein
MYETIDLMGTWHPPKTQQVRARVYKSIRGYGYEIYPHTICWRAGNWSTRSKSDPLSFLHSAYRSYINLHGLLWNSEQNFVVGNSKWQSESAEEC